MTGAEWLATSVRTLTTKIRRSTGIDKTARRVDHGTRSSRRRGARTGPGAGSPRQREEGPMGDIGTERREVEFEPVREPTTAPVREPDPAPQEPVPARS